MRAIGIVAFDESLGIGYRGGLPWPDHLLDRFFWKTLSLTCGQLFMGSAQAMQKPARLGIRNYTITRCPDKRDQLEGAGYTVINTLDEIEAIEGSLAILGGERIYRDMAGRFDGLAVARVPGRYPCDRHFPAQPGELGLVLDHSVKAASTGQPEFTFEWWARPGG